LATNRFKPIKRWARVNLCLEPEMSINHVTFVETGRHAVVPRLIAIVAQVVMAFRAYRQHLTGIATLRGMSDRDLKDIGVYRGDLDRIADDARRNAIDAALRTKSVSTLL
jgi:uncharacterized protein YjiS (DUF1127 family)